MIESRPPWVRQSVLDLKQVQEKIIEATILLSVTATSLRGIGGRVSPTSADDLEATNHDLVHALHDLVHAMDHVISVRHKVEMTWSEN